MSGPTPWPLALEDAEAFVAWLAARCGWSPDVSPSVGWAALSPFDRLAAVMQIEAHLGEEFPEDLLDELRTLDDLWHFSLVKSHHRTPT